MQYTTDLFGLTFIVGMMLAVISAICFLYLWGEVNKISIVPSFYCFGSIISFFIGMSIVIGEPEYPLYSIVGLVGGCFLFVMAFIQTYYERRVKEKSVAE